MSEVVSPHRRGRRFVLAGAAVAALAAAGAGWYGWLWWTTPAPPNISLDGVDPEVASAIRAALGRVRKEGRSGAAWGALGQVLLAHDHFEDGDACFAQAERFDPKEPRWPFYRGLTRSTIDAEGALPFLKRAVELCDRYDRGNDGPRLLLAETLLKMGANAEAEDQFNRVLALDPGNPRVHYDLGVLAEARRDDAAAVGHFTESATSPYARQKSCSALAAIRQRQGDAAGAAEYSRRAAAPPEDRLWPDRYVGEYQILDAGRRGRFEEAVRLEAQGRLPEALPVLLELAEDDSDARAQIAVGIALLKLGRVQEGEHYFRAAIGKESEQAEANNFLAVALYQEAEQLGQRPGGDSGEAQRKYEEAAACAARALALKPDHSTAYLYQGMALAKLGRRREAIESLRQAVLLRPEMADPHFALADALFDDGQRKEARAEYRRALDVAAPDDRRRDGAAARLHAADEGSR